jgi:hypothetical protein
MHLRQLSIAILSLTVLASCGESAPKAQDIFCPLDAIYPVEDASGVDPFDVAVAEDVNSDTAAPDTAGLCEAEPGSFGCPCTTNGDCEEGWCVEGAVGYVCTKSCLTECPEGYDCKSVYGGTDLVFLCVPRVLALCTPCSEDVQCTGGACLVLDGETQCAYKCEVDSDCPMGFGCQADPSGEHPDELYCMPQTGSCSCNALISEGQRTCSKETELGSCFGVETCDQSVGWSGCDAKDPIAEDCDGVDNDCDGFIDEDLPQDETCFNVVPGLGACSGTKTCFGPLGWSCQAPEPEVEVCDYKDNDCDDAVDEDFMTAGVYDTYEHCGACNSDCSSQFPNAVETACEVFGGQAQCVIVSCQQGYTKANDFQCLPNIASLCQPCATDDNCLGEGSACVELVDGSFCGQPCSEQADCEQGYSCADVGTPLKQCVPSSGSCSCDGTNTELSKACSVTYTPDDPNQPAYTCNGYQQCTENGWDVCNLPDEDCDGVDNDCDGTVDEDFKTNAGLYLLVEHCGGCNISCLALAVPNAFPICSTAGGIAQCGFTCKENFFDVNGDPNDGCECSPVPGDDLAGDGVDSDCDGMDGEKTKGVFVAKNGSDVAAGTYDAPVLTITEGIKRASQFGKRDVYVATGVYSESIQLANGVGVFGGYSSDFAEHNSVLFETAIIGQSPTGNKPGAVNGIDVGKGNPQPTILDGFTVFGANAAVSLGATSNSYAVYLYNCGQGVEIRANRIFGGAGGAGMPGSKGFDGPDGKNGTKGKDAYDVDKFTFNGNRYCTEDDHNMGGIGGELNCAIPGSLTGVDVSGGNGGTAACPAFGQDPQGDQYGEQGEPWDGDPNQQGGDGGSAGHSLKIESVNDCSFCAIPGAEDTPIDGGLGLPGVTGVWGPSGQGCGKASGTVVGGHWNSLPGGDGANGLPGSGGGGGGSGGGVEVKGKACTSNAGLEVNVGGHDVAGSGGGGGSGGCAGAGGSGGSGGGGSFGIFMAYDNAPVSLPVLTSNQVQRGFGGAGGSGGGGGAGGVGGFGSAGGSSGQGSIETLCARGGSPGGQGGQGGHAGGGGGGCGGASFGIYVWLADGNNDLNSYKLQNAFLPGGAGGLGGAGGSSPGNTGASGAKGANVDANF